MLNVVSFQLNNILLNSGCDSQNYPVSVFCDCRYGEYLLKKNYKILDYINGFDKFLDEDTLWSMSEHIKPRGSTKTS
jgi:hypothetical protein